MARGSAADRLTMSPQPSTESEVRRELLRLSMRNSARSVPALLIVAGFIAVLGQQAGRLFAAMAVVALGLAIAALRVAMARSLAPAAPLDDAAFAQRKRGV